MRSMDAYVSPLPSLFKAGLQEFLFEVIARSETHIHLTNRKKLTSISFQVCLGHAASHFWRALEGLTLSHDRVCGKECFLIKSNQISSVK